MRKSFVIYATGFCALLSTMCVKTAGAMNCHVLFQVQKDLLARAESICLEKKFRFRSFISY
jgi:hypothetical protein